MKTKHIIVLFLSLSWIDLFGHDIPVHRAITVNAAASALSGFSASTDFLNMISSDCDLFTATNSMVEGSAHEDDKLDQDHVGGYRSLNHFYDPTKNPPIGLTDQPWPLPVAKIGRDSFTWASISNSPGQDSYLESGKYNIWSWPNARSYEWIGLTANNKADRISALTNMFRAVGQVMHLLQDTSQPQHVRNEQHLDRLMGMDMSSRSAIEDFYKKHSLNYQQGMLDWRSSGFNRLEDFWNRDLLRTEGATALDADYVGGTSTLGLAEFTSGNFIGQRAIYGKFFPNQNDIHYFAFPSLSYTTQPNLKQNRLWDTATKGNVTLANFKQGTRLYISKTGAGVPVTYHSALSYLIAEHPGKSSGLPIVTIADDNVLSNYHNIFIPKAVQYSAGLLDYFFRGTMSVSLHYDASSSTYTFTNRNTSTQDFYNGSFYLFEDASTNRTPIQTNNLSDLITGGKLPPANSVNITYSGSAPTGTKFLVVYQGTIGQTNNTALDQVDQNIGIASARPAFEQISNYPDDWFDLTNSSQIGSSFSTNLDSPDFSIAPTIGNFEVVVNSAILDDFGSIGGVDSIGTNYPSPISNMIVNPTNVTIVGNHLRVVLSVTDVNGGLIGYQNVTITWRQFLPPQP
jgi:hypothetical protein